MTLGDLIRKAKACGNQFNTWEIPLYGENGHILKDVEFEEDRHDDGTWYVNMRIKEG